MDDRTESATAYRQRAELHRPTDPFALEVEIRRLAGAGWTARDISAALRIDPVGVMTTLAAPHSPRPDGAGAVSRTHEGHHA